MAELPWRPYVVRCCEPIEQLARRCGVDARVVWDDPRNQSLREQRKRPDALHAGDVVWLPAPRALAGSVAAGGTHESRARATSQTIRARVLDRRVRALRDRTFVLRAGTLTIEGRTGSDGEFRIELPAHVTHAELRVEGNASSTDAETWALHLVPLPPAGTIAGLQARLVNLGHLRHVSGVADAETLAAVGQFQRVHGVQHTGRIDHETVSAVCALHDEPATDPPAGDADANADMPRSYSNDAGVGIVPPAKGGRGGQQVSLKSWVSPWLTFRISPLTSLRLSTAVIEDRLFRSAFAMLMRMRDELWGYFGIAAHVIVVTYAGRGQWNQAPAPGALIDELQLHLNDRPDQVRARNQALPRVQGAPTDWDTVRHRLATYIEDGETIYLETEEDNQPLIAFYTSATQQVISVNPFTYYVDDGAGRFVEAFGVSSERARVALGPTVCLLHETVHLRAGGYGPFFPAAHPNTNRAINMNPNSDSETEATQDVDRALQSVTGIAQRVWYGGGEPWERQNLPGMRYVLGAGGHLLVETRVSGMSSGARVMTDAQVVAAGHEWVRWPTARQLTTGLR